MAVCALAALVPAPPAAAHSGHDRSRDIAISNEIRVTGGEIEIRQTQSYQGPMALSLFIETDADADGSISASERTSGEAEGARQFAEAMGVSVDWAGAAPIDVTARFDDLPERRPQGPSVTIRATIRARYRFPPADGVRAVTIDIGQLNAQRITGSIDVEPGLAILKHNCGTLESGAARVANMESVAGTPGTFSLLVSARGADASGPLAPGAPGVPPPVAALACTLLFATGFWAGRRPPAVSESPATPDSKEVT